MDKKYDIIYADPPWRYGTGYDRTLADDYFPCMSFEDLKNLEVENKLAEDNCLLFLWVVSPELKTGIELGEAWGFQYITVGFVWQKPNRVLFGSYTMPSTELCLIFRKKKGKIPQPRGTRNERQFLSQKAENRACKKPKEIIDRITRMFPTQNKIELFARNKKEGWDIWGNEVESDINL